jgi:hypothetical protein
MGSGISHVSIMRIVVVLLHVSLVGKSCDEEPETDGHENSLPDGLRNLVPHLLIEHVDLLHSPNVIFLAWGISQAPDSKVVHVSHLGPGVLELDTVGDDLVLKCWLLVVS